ncbi:hypothetical protein GCM10007079_33030 [Nocardiopsis terrae]|uniref:DUF5753 domain-containing protein n=1 Tax=Nocardiopsis terrae TaxID=372655 RepID=A0ABR9HJD4_9ACTN|nr:hypothetical protein [Nocardiopsis terrae]MBE1459118.1 hypothetical protein [Nocardiopsis terrae]GHC88237.1 hypothetical protein GCM10007079_33030 [Nocardiopsis terrae]
MTTTDTGHRMLMVMSTGHDLPVNTVTTANGAVTRVDVPGDLASHLDYLAEFARTYLEASERERNNIRDAIDQATGR